MKILSMEKHLKSYVKSFRDHIDKIEQTGNAKIAWIRRLEKRKREIERAVSVLTKRTRFEENEKKKKKKSVPLSPPPPPPKSLKSSQEGENKKREKKSPSQMNESSDSTFSDVGMMGGDFMDEFSMTGDDMNDAASVNADDGLYF